ncbi:hypothetical protein PsorP6_010337 [Peronosclerospora sorghi]|uniref:Uncharacterized protein n=1 Tax=Peronosclerospora sorghi TaxID=230839 RepID=A0ACC0VVG1_9STRA|nr:hypothetical protein PsorP6_010337 [Peronosclerospora sorghi]
MKNVGTRKQRAMEGSFRMMGEEESLGWVSTGWKNDACFRLADGSPEPVFICGAWAIQCATNVVTGLVSSCRVMPNHRAGVMSINAIAYLGTLHGACCSPFQSKLWTR